MCRRKFIISVNGRRILETIRKNLKNDIFSYDNENLSLEHLMDISPLLLKKNIFFALILVLGLINNLTNWSKLVQGFSKGMYHMTGIRKYSKSVETVLQLARLLKCRPLLLFFLGLARQLATWISHYSKIFHECLRCLNNLPDILKVIYAFSKLLPDSPRLSGLFQTCWNSSTWVQDSLRYFNGLLNSSNTSQNFFKTLLDTFSSLLDSFQRI